MAQNSLDLPQAVASDSVAESSARANLSAAANLSAVADLSAAANLSAVADLSAAADLLGKPMDLAAKNTTDHSTEFGSVSAGQQSYLEAGVDKIASLVISDKDTRQSVDHYSCEFLTTAALFARGRLGLAGTVVLYGLATASPDSNLVTQVEDFALGAVKGLGTRAIFAGANFLPTAPLKGVVTGIGSRTLENVVNRDTFTDPAKTMEKLKSDTFSGQAMFADAATWTIGEGLFHGSNYLSGGRLAKNPIVHGVAMGASFGAVNGTNAEIAREKAAGESIDVSKIVQHGLIEAVIGGAAAGGGTGLSMSRANGVHVTEVGSGSRLTAGSGETGVSLFTADGAQKPGGPGNTAKLADVFDLSKMRLHAGVPADALNPESKPDAGLEAKSDTRSAPPPKTAAREFVVDAGKEEFKGFRNRQSDSTFLNVRELFKDADGKDLLGPKKLLFVQKLGTGGDNTLEAGAEKADLIVSSHPELLSEADRSKHIFPDGEGKVWLAMGGKSSFGSKNNTLRLATGDVQLSDWRKEGFVDPIRLDNGNVTLSVMAPLLVGDPHDLKGEGSRAAWIDLDRQLSEAKKLGVDAVSTDVWWGLVEPKKGEFDWSYYEKLSDHIKQAGLKWVPILSFHQCGGNVGDNVSVPLPDWVWHDVAAKAANGDVEAVKYKSEQGHTSREYVSLWADHAVIDHYADVMKEFQSHFADKAKDIGEVNVSLGPAGELRYPSYNAHDNNTGYPTRGALQSYSDLAIASFKKYMESKYGGADGVGKAWGIEKLDDSHILPPSDVTAFFGRGDHFNTQYGRDFFDWYNQSLVDHGHLMLSTAVKVFGQKDSAFYGIDLGAKVPGVHWRIGERQGDRINLGDREAELTAGLIATSRGDWDRDEDGRGYRPIFSMFKSLQPITPGLGNRMVPGFTCLEMPDGDGGPSVRALPHTLATWAGMEAERQGLWLKGENALNGNLYNNSSWDLMRGFLTLPNQHGYYHGLTFLRMSDIVDNDTARNRMSQLNSARNAFEAMRQSLRRMFGRTA